MDRTKWLDGLRGVAATIVAFDHFFMGDIWHPFISFWAEPPEENRRIIQLPPIRILFSAHAMVTLFMVISGYAISINLIKAREQQNSHTLQRGQSFFNKLSSAVLRRVFRIYLPVLVISIISQLLFFFNLYNWTFDEGVLRGIQPLTSPFAHIKWLIIYMMDSMNMIAFEYNGGFNGQLWTMPVEYRGSCVIYLFMIGLAGWKKSLRLWVLPTLAVYFLWYGIWDIFGFLWGLWLAERAAGGYAHGDPRATEIELESDTDGDFDDSEKLLPLHRLPGQRYWKHWRALATAERMHLLSNILTGIAFVMGIHLLCLGDDGKLTPGYQWLEALNSHKWKDNWQVYHWCWKSVGAAVLVYSVSNSQMLQRPLNTRIIQYLGKISFSLYLVHQAIYHLWRDPLRNWIYLTLSGTPYPGTYDGLKNDPVSFHLTWWITGFILGPIVALSAHYYTIYVDNKCVVLTKRVEKWLTT